MKHPLYRHTLLLTALTSVSTPLLANTVQLEPLLVTVTTPLRMAQPLHETQAATTVITRADIERQQPESVAQLLRGHAGIEFASSGGAGSITSLFMRGSNSNHTLVMIDGVKINNPTSGGVSWQYLPVNQIERVEIVRGPQSSVWGADAIGGVINIITRKANTPGTTGEIRLGVGQQNTRLTDANFSAANATTRFTSSLSYRGSDSINARTADTSGEKDGYEHYGLRLQLEHDLNERNTLSAGYLRSQGDNQYDSCSIWPAASNNCKEDYSLQTLSLGWTHQLTNAWQMEALLQRVEEDREDFFESQNNGRTHTQRDQLGIKATLSTDPFSLVSGFDAQKERILKGSGFTQDSRDIFGVFAQTHYRLTDAWTLSAGVRHDDDEFFGNQTTGNLGLDWQLHSAHNIGASISQGYRAPNLMELYGPASWGANPDLMPEESINYELFWRYQPGSAFNAEVRLFQNEIDNLIVWSAGQNLNINESRIRGAEVTLGYQLANWRFSGALTLQDPINREDDSLLLRRAREHGRIDIDYAVSNWGAGATLEGQSKRYDFGGQRMGGYVLLNTHAHWQLSSDWTLRAKIDNLFDQDYEQALGYHTPGRYVETSLTYRF
ncbi:TonB-dependent receptor plug domain-containing protein [Nitrincola iocasae]|uniref:TonB-dependent receptor n=1 Tax=Nitrincola iocasae TaxID=2614693 RepID=A0A5J6LGH5_9GAMM|nr:TonB-dependent receptor [Nitrincola iocasae]QEW07462.1 TonB-dependent receptor [Nitrincola iocasae]